MDGNQKRLIYYTALYTICNLIVITFVNFYIWRTNDDFYSILRYNLFVFTGMIIGGFCAGLSTQYFSSKRILQIALLLYIGQLATVLMVGQNALPFLPIIGLLSGLATGSQYYAVTTLGQLATAHASRESFYGTQRAVL